MKLKGLTRFAGVLVTLMASSAVHAQDGSSVVIMRKPLNSMPGQPQVGPSYRWELSDWYLDRQACGATTQTRLIGCVDRNGNAAPDEMCKDPVPQLTREATDYSICTFSWQSTPGEWNSTCSASAQRPITSRCVRQDGQPAEDDKCDASKRPPATETGLVDGGCSYQWSISDWGEWSDTCSSSSSRKRAVACRRSDGSDVSPSFCQGEAPGAEEVAPNYTGCSYQWVQGQWSDPDSTCSAKATSTRTNGCQRSDGQSVDASYCDPATQPATERSEENFSGCSYDWTAGTYGDWSSTCSGNATRTRDVSCFRSDGTSASAGDCTGVKPSTDENAAIYEGCTFAWITGEWVTPNSCGTGQVRTRSVSCTRSDGSAADASQCDAGSRPADIESLPDYGSCEYEWVASYGQWSGTCTDQATRSVTSTCIRSDGQTVSDAQCNPAARPAGTQTASNYTGCSYSWSTETWSDWQGHCTPTSTRSRAVSCLREGTYPADRSMCDPTTKPAEEEARADYSQCGFVWSAGQWDSPPPSCSESVKVTRTVQCTNEGTGEVVPDAQCTGTRPETEKTVSNYSGCTYKWDISDWGPYNSTCSTSATRSRTVRCVRSDGEAATTSQCPTPIPASVSEPTRIVTDCGGNLTNGGFETGDLTGWSQSGSGTPIATTSTVHGGKYSLSITPYNVLATVTQQIDTKAGVTYSVSAWAYSYTGATPVLEVLNAGNTVVAGMSWVVNNGNGLWSQKSTTFSGDGGKYTIKLTNPSNTRLPRIDDIIVSVASAP